MIKTKICSKCKIEKSIDNFCKQKQGKNGFYAHCRECTKKWRNENKEKLKKQRAEYYFQNKKIIQQKQSHNRRKYFYGLDKEEYELILKKCDNKCEICGKSAETQLYKKLSVDHCHKTNKVRGLLCRACNVFIAQIEKNDKLIVSAIQYLKKHNTILVMENFS